MSEENVEIVRSRYVPVGSIDPEEREGWFAAFAGDIEICPAIAQRVEGRKVYRGHAGLREWIADTSAAFASFEPVVHEITSITDDHVLVDVTWRARGRVSGVQTEERVWQLWTIHRGLITRSESFFSRRHSLEAAGLSE